MDNSNNNEPKQENHKIETKKIDDKVSIEIDADFKFNDNMSANENVDEFVRPADIKEKKIDDKTVIEIAEEPEVPEVPPMPMNRIPEVVLRRRRNMIITTVAILVVAVLTVVGMFLFGDKKDDKKKQPEVNASTNVNERSMVLTVEGNSIAVRTPWNKNKDLAYRIKIGPNAQCGFKINDVVLMNKSSSRSSVAGEFEQFKSMGRDVTGFKFTDVTNETVGINEGWKYGLNIHLVNHGMTEKDIGSIFSDKNGREFVIVHVTDADNFLIYPSVSQISSPSYVFSYAKTPLKFVSGKGKVGNINFNEAESSKATIFSVVNNLSYSVFANGEEVNLSKNGYIKCENGVRAEVSYGIIDIFSALNYLIDNAGNNTNTSIVDDKISNYFEVTYSYLFTINGACTINQSVKAKKQLDINNFMLMRCTVMEGENTKVYIPNTNKYLSLKAMPTTDKEVTRSEWLSENIPPYRYFTFADSDCSKGFCVGFNNTYGSCASENIIDNITNSAKFSAENHYIAPYIFSKPTTLKKNQEIDVQYYFIPTDKSSNYFTDKDFNAITWYWDNDDIYLMLDAKGEIDKEVKLPAYMANMKCEVIDSNNVNEIAEKITLESDVTTKFSFLHYESSSDSSYAVIKLTK